MIHHLSIRIAGLAIATGLSLAGACWTTASAPPPLVIAESDLSIAGDLGPFRASWEVQRPEANLMLATLDAGHPGSNIHSGGRSAAAGVVA